MNRMNGIAAAVTLFFAGLMVGPAARADLEYVSLGVTAYHYDMAVDSTDTIHVVWKPGLGPAQMLYGTLEGETLSESDTIPGSGLVKRARTKPRLAVQEGGETLHMVWMNATNTVLTHAWREDGLWTTRDLFDGAPNHRYDPMIAVCPDGALHVIAQHENETSIACSVRPASGSWQAETIIHEDTRQVRDTFIVCDQTGVHAGWTRHYGHADPGGVLESGSMLPHPSGTATLCCGDFAVGTDGTVHYALKSFPLQIIVYTYKPPSGDWVEPVRVSLEEDLEPECPDGGGYEVWPAIAVGDNGKVFVAWAYTDCSGDNVAPFVKMAIRETDGTWDHVDVDMDAAIPVAHAKPLLANAGGTVHLAWTVPGTDGPELVLHTIDTSVVGPDEPVEEVMDGVVEESVPEEVQPEIPDGAADTAPDTALDISDVLQDGTGGAEGGCGCTLAL
jgi:hypothetical protein